MSLEVHRLPVADGEAVVVDWYPTAPGALAALYVHGLGSHRRGEKTRYFARCFNELGWAYASVDLRGHGDADGAIRDLTMDRLLADVAATTGWLASRAAPRPLLIGASMGAAVVAWHDVLEPQLGGPLALLAPSLGFPGSLRAGLTPEALAQWQTRGARHFTSEWIDVELGFGLVEDAGRYDSGRLYRELAHPVLIVHGLHDATIPPRASVEFANACDAVDVYLVGGGDHRLTDHAQRIFDVIWSWRTSL
jgi:pimeloyl-ACP methyl ester carboxylesterase